MLTFDDRTYRYGVGNRLTSDGIWNHSYDASGNVITREADEASQAFTYDALNRMAEFTDATGKEKCTYDDGETRVKKIADDRTTYYVSVDYEEVWQNGQRIEVVKHYRAGDQKVATRDDEGLKYIYPDHLGSATRLADTNGRQAKAIWYMPFGGTTREQGDAKARYRFTGKEKDDSGLYYYGARYYDDSVGRFLAADSILPDVFDPQLLNRFAYVRNNPIKLVDPDGHIPLLAIPLLATAPQWGPVVAALAAGVASAVVGAIAADRIHSAAGGDPWTVNQAGYAVRVSELHVNTGSAISPSEIRVSNADIERALARLQNTKFQPIEATVDRDAIESKVQALASGESLQPVQIDATEASKRNGNVVVMNGHHTMIAHEIVNEMGYGPVQPQFRDSTEGAGDLAGEEQWSNIEILSHEEHRKTYAEWLGDMRNDIEDDDINDDDK